MKQGLIFMLALAMASLADCGYAQTTQKRNRMKVRTEERRPAKKQSGKSMNSGTVGVMGSDSVKLSKKGMRANQNANTGVALPPSDGGN